MARYLFRYLFPLLLFFGCSLSGAENWEQLKIGMNTEEATAALGVPLIKTLANGFELWIYDNQAEAIFYGGPLVGWTTPKTSKSAPVSVDVWQRKAGQPDRPAFILPRYRPPVKKIDAPKGDGVYSLPYYRVRS